MTGRGKRLRNLAVALVFPAITAACGPTINKIDICNASPARLSLAVNIKTLETGKFQTVGWWNLKPGACKRFATRGRHFFFYADSGNDPVGKYINSNKRLVFRSYLPWRGYCVSTKAFTYDSKTRCRTKAWFQRVKITAPVSMYRISDPWHKNLPLASYPIIRRKLLGRMAFEQHLRNRVRRERKRLAPFQIGIEGVNTPQGVRVTRLFTGMPANEVGIRVNETIVSLNGMRVRSLSDLNTILDNIDIFRKSPLKLQIRDAKGALINGSVVPLFYPYLHREWRSTKVSTFVHSFVHNGLIAGNQVLCSAKALAGETVRSWSDRYHFKKKRVAHSASACIKVATRSLTKKKILHAEAYSAGLWSSLLVGIPVTKLSTKLPALARRIPISARSRYVARSGSARLQRLKR